MPWAYAIARNKFLEFRRQQTKVTRLHTIGLSECNEPSQASFSNAKDLSIDLNFILQQLSEPVREAFVLKHFQKLTFARIAELQEIPLPTAKSRVLFAIKKIREFLHRGEK